MAIASTISAAELARIVQDQFVNKSFEVALVNASGASYSAETTVDADFMLNEVSTGTGGYARQIVSWEGADVAPYSDSGIGLATKVAVFTHDGSVNTINFTHVVLLRGVGNIDELAAAASSVPTNVGADTMLDGTYLSLPTNTAGNGEGATVDIEIINNGANGINDYTVTLVNRGRGYLATDSIEITPASLIAAGACTVDLGSIVVPVQAIRNDGGTIVSATETATPVILGNGNEAVFYFNNKVFGFADGDS